MKKTLLIIMSIVSINAVTQTSFNFSINGSFKNTKDNSKIFIHHKWDDGTFTDSLKLKGGKFVLNGKSSEPNMYWITKTNNPNEQPNLIFFVDAGKTSVTGNIDSLPFAAVSGGSTQKDYVDYKTYSLYLLDFNYKQYNCLDELYTHESNWNPLSKNGSHYGLGQMRSEHYRTLDPYRQIDATIKYITIRYGSMCNAWRFHMKKGHY